MVLWWQFNLMLDTCCKERLVVLRIKVHQWAVQKNTGKGTLVASLLGEAGGVGGQGIPQYPDLAPQKTLSGLTPCCFRWEYIRKSISQNVCY